MDPQGKPVEGWPAGITIRLGHSSEEDFTMRYMTLLALLATFVFASPAEAGRCRPAKKSCCAAA
ncbi:MAG: hypothetical protein ACKPJJ_15465, partial [Planctomycetaceae bacterium]